jgi:hypothetical protein
MMTLIALLIVSVVYMRSVYLMSAFYNNMLDDIRVNGEAACLKSYLMSRRVCLRVYYKPIGNATAEAKAVNETASADNTPPDRAADASAEIAHAPPSVPPLAFIEL